MKPLLSLLLLLALVASPALLAEEPAKLDPRYPFRTDFANANLPWYQPKPGEFPPHHSDRRIAGELVTADFIHRTGQFRGTKTGELIDFTMPPYGSVNYLNADADLRDVPLGTFFLFFLNQDARGEFTRLATMQDQFTMDAGHGFSYRLTDLKLAQGKLETTKQSPAKNQPDLGPRELLVRPETRVWKGDQQVKLTDLATGDALLYNLTGRTADSPGWCTDVWVGAETHLLATEQQHKKFGESLRRRGLPAWIDHTQGSTLTVTLFSGDAAAFKKAYLPALEIGKELSVVVANEELRTWNPPVDKERGSLVEIQNTPVDAYGTSGVRLVCTVPYMLEGFRRGRVVRLFPAGWPIKDQPFAESLMGYGYRGELAEDLTENTAREYPAQFPYRTEYGNENLPWYRLQPGATPPKYSEHVVYGALVKADAAKRSGQIKVDRTGEALDFTVIGAGAVRYLNTESKLDRIPLGTRCRLHLYQDETGAFTQATLVSDDFSYMAANATSWRIEQIKPAENLIIVARQLGEVKNYNGDMEQPADVGRTELRLTPETRVWKGEQPLQLTDLAPGDVLLGNTTGEQTGAPAHCTDLWIGAETHKLVTARESGQLTAAKK